MRPAGGSRSGTALLLAGILVVSTLIVIEFANLSSPLPVPPGGTQGGGGGSQGNNTSNNNPGGRLIARFLFIPTPNSAPQPARGIPLQIDSNTTVGTIKPKSVRVSTNPSGYAFASLVPGPYILSTFEPGWSLIGSFNITEGRNTDFNATVAGVTVPVAAYDLQDPDSSSMLGPWATLAVSIPKDIHLGVNQTAFFESNGPPIVLGGPLFVNIRNYTSTGFPPQNLTGGPSISGATVTGVYPFSSGQWVTLQPTGTMPLSQFYGSELLFYQATYKTALEGP